MPHRAEREGTVITDHLGIDSLVSLAGHWASEDSYRGKLSRAYRAAIDGRDSDLNASGLYALIRFAGAELGITPEPRYA
jgi:hypothetical protein